MKTSIKRLGAAALTLAMVGTSLSSFTFAEEAETYDFGGATVRVYGNQWGNINPDAENAADKAVYFDYAAQVEAKYNIKLEYVDANAYGHDGYNMAEVIQTTASAGETFADIIDVGPEGIMKLIAGGYVCDITDHVDELEVGSLYTEAVTWAGKCYGLTFDNIGDTYVLAYSRDFFEECGIEETPTDKFMAGEWSYDDVREYFTEIKANLGDVYPIGVHYYHWQSMSGAANGAPAITSDGTINITNENYIESLEFYADLIADGLAAPMVVEVTDDPESATGLKDVDIPYGTSGMNVTYAMTRYESWEFGGLQDALGQWGITYWPWGDNVTCEGDYTTLSDTYQTAQAYWGNCMVVSDAPERTGIEAIDLLKIAQDYYALCSPSGHEARHAAWEAEQAGEEPQIGYERGTARKFCTPQDIELYDWGHDRVVYDWAKPFSDADIISTWNLAKEIIAGGRDGREVAQKYYESGLKLAQEQGFIAVDEDAVEETSAAE